MNEDGFISRVQKVVRMGTTLYVCIPHKFAEKHNIKAGDKVAVVVNDTMKVVPLGEKV